MRAPEPRTVWQANAYGPLPKPMGFAHVYIVGQNGQGWPLVVEVRSGTVHALDPDIWSLCYFDGPKPEGVDSPSLEEWKNA